MRTINLKKGLDLRLQGEVTDTTSRYVSVGRVAITPDDFPGFTPKAVVKDGDKVMVGSPLLQDKNCPEVKLVSPVNGTVEAVVRGERRKIERVVVKVDTRDSLSPQYDGLPKASPADTADAAAIRSAMQATGLWTCLRQRPYDVVPRGDCQPPRDIFVTSFDSAPLAPSLLNSVNAADVDAGVKFLAKLTPGKVYIGVRKGGPTQIDGAECVLFNGPHPAGNAGVQASNIAPVNKGETIWTLDVVTVARLGHLMTTGELDTMTTVAVAGPEVKKPELVTTVIGADVSQIIDSNLKPGECHRRIIAGSVLTGVNVGGDGYLRFPYRQLTVICEGDDADEFMGWASPGLGKMSQSPTFLSRLFPNKRFAPDARLHGGRRAMILSGEYDKVFPMDILPEYLVKAIIARDIDKMEQLGIYEVAPEDFALCEYVDASKIELQKIVREGLDYLRKELE